MNPSGITFWKFSRKGSFFQKAQKILIFFNVLRLQASITPQWLLIDGNSLPNDSPYGMSSLHFYHLNQFKVIPVACTLRRINFLPNFLRRRTWVDGTADDADISRSQAASDDRLLSHVTLRRVECRKQTASAQIAERFEPNTVLWAFYTIQPSSFK